MKLILKNDVANLGETGEVVTVSDGYARNYLLPNGFAIVATTGSLKDLNLQMARLKVKAEKKHQQDLDTAKEIEAVGQLNLKARAGEGGKLFGTVTTRELAKLITDKTGLVVDRKNLTLNNPINRLGEYTVTLKLSSKVSASLKVQVDADDNNEEE